MNTYDDTILSDDEIALLQALLDNAANLPGTRQTAITANAKQKLSRLR